MHKDRQKFWIRYLSGKHGFTVWAGFMVLNIILGLSFFLLNRTDWRFFPIPGMDIYSWQELFIARDHVDLLRMNAEISLGIAIWVLWSSKWERKGRIWYRRFFFVFYVFTLIYKIYGGILTGLYQMQPNFYSDVHFFLDGLPFFFNAMNLPRWFFPVVGVGVPILLVGLWLGTRRLFKSNNHGNFGPLNRSIWAGIGLIILGYSLFYGSELSKPEFVVNSLVAEVIENIQRSLDSLRAVTVFDPSSPYRVYDYGRFPLEEKPDIYLIFLESYGSVLYTKEYFREPYLKFLDVFEQRIESAGWQAASIYSEAPTWGGGTWMSYTSAIFGLSVQDQSEYIALHETYQEIPYPNLGRYFYLQGYEYVWIAPIQRRISDEREEKDQKFFGFDRLITLEDMRYNGLLFGWGPSPPDQYTFDFIGDFVNSQTQPTFLVFLTQNSHYPYTPLPPIIDNVKLFSEMNAISIIPDTGGDKERVFRETRQHYMDAVSYTFAALEALIVKIQDPNAVLILMGDHQPPAVSYKGDGYATMVHILSRNEDLVRGFQQYGFSPGLVLETPGGSTAEVGMIHAGFYSLFVRNMVERFGPESSDLPPYLPNGLKE